MSEGEQKRSRGLADWLALVLAVGALGVSGYLSYVSLVTGISPAGCGSGSGCAAVLASKWSRVLGVPVSLLAVVAYLDILFALVMETRGAGWMRRLTRPAIAIWSGVIVGSAAWFMYIQLVELGAVCPYCMTGHGLGIALVVTLVCQRGLKSFKFGWIGLVPVVLMAALQVSSTGAVTTIDNAAGELVEDTTNADGRRSVTLLNGQLTFDLDEEPVLGSADAEYVVALMFDYACLHCRHTHGVLERVRDDYPGRVAVVMMPMPMNPACNEHVAEDLGARFAESCELVRIGLAVFFADRDAFQDFDRWMYEPAVARTAEAARTEAARRVGYEAFEQSYADPRMEQMLARNVDAYGLSGAERVPVLVLPGGHESAAIVGRIDAAQQVIELLGLGVEGGSP